MDLADGSPPDSRSMAPAAHQLELVMSGRQGLGDVSYKSLHLVGPL